MYTNFFLEFGLNGDEVRKLNKMYFKDLYKERLRIFFGFVFSFYILYSFFDLNSDLITWIIRNIAFVIVFLIFQYYLVNTTSKIIFRIVKNCVTSDRFISGYKFNFTNSVIYVRSPLGEFAHNWSQIEKAILTKEFFFLYVKEKKGYIISISNKDQNRDLEELIAFVEGNVIAVTKV